MCRGAMLFLCAPSTQALLHSFSDAPCRVAAKLFLRVFSGLFEANEEALRLPGGGTMYLEGRNEPHYTFGLRTKMENRQDDLRDCARIPWEFVHTSV